jgi:hypothetical protein
MNSSRLLDATDARGPCGSEIETEEEGTPAKLAAGKLAGEAEATLALLSSNRIEGW